MTTRRILSLVIGLTIASGASVTAAPATPVASKKTVPYPLTTCIVTENDLNSMGGAITRVYQGQEVKFCCKPCIKKFDADPPKYLARLPKADGK